MAASKLIGKMEARARELSPRGIPYQVGETAMPVGEWVSVTHEDAHAIEFMGWPVTVREKAAPEKEAPANG